MEPPLILVCLRDRSRATAAVRARRAFSVHFLDSAQAGLARKFATGHPDKFEGVPYSINTLGVPCLDESRRCLEYRPEREHEGGDHVILAGLVEGSRHVDTFEPLLYSQRSDHGRGAALAVPHT